MRFKYTDEQVEWLREHVPGTPFKEVCATFCDLFKVEKTTNQIQVFCNSAGIRNGLTGGRFEKGNASWNKGKKGMRVSPATEFKKGHLPANHREVGDERINKDGYTYVKVSMFRDKKANDCWVAKHRLVWEQANGPIPEGHKIIFRDGDKTNITLDNLICVSSGDLATMNHLGLYGHGKEETDTALLICNVASKAYERKCAQRSKKQRGTPRKQVEIR